MQDYRYYIFQNGAIVETTSEHYEQWQENEWPELKLPDLKRRFSNICLSLESRWVGAIDKGEGIYPFVVLYFEDRWLDTAGESMLNIDETIEYFETYDKYVKYYEAQKQRMNERFFAYGS